MQNWGIEYKNIHLCRLTAQIDITFAFENKKVESKVEV